jgi:hypothetical protein
MFNIILFLIHPTIVLLSNYLKKNKKKINVIFDLDNTLIISMEKNKYSNLNISHKPTILNLRSSLISTTRVVWARPMVSTVLYLLNKFTNIYLYTHAEKTYADNILLQLNIDEYFKDCRYREDNIDTKDIITFFPEIDKIEELNKNLSKLKKYNRIDKISQEMKDKIYKTKLKLEKSLKKYLKLQDEFLSKSILIDDLKTNNCLDQEIYHIKYFYCGMEYDIELLKLLIYMFYRNYIRS